MHSVVFASRPTPQRQRRRARTRQPRRRPPTTCQLHSPTFGERPTTPLGPPRQLSRRLVCWTSWRNSTAHHATPLALGSWQCWWFQHRHHRRRQPLGVVVLLRGLRRWQRLPPPSCCVSLRRVHVRFRVHGSTLLAPAKREREREEEEASELERSSESPRRCVLLLAWLVPRRCPCRERESESHSRSRSRSRSQNKSSGHCGWAPPRPSYLSMGPRFPRYNCGNKKKKRTVVGVKPLGVEDHARATWQGCGL